MSPLPVTVTTRIITFLVGDPYKPSFATVTGKGDNPTYSIYLPSLGTITYPPPKNVGTFESMIFQRLSWDRWVLCFLLPWRVFHFLPVICRNDRTHKLVPSLYNPRRPRGYWGTFWQISSWQTPSNRHAAQEVFGDQDGTKGCWEAIWLMGLWKATHLERG